MRKFVVFLALTLLASQSCALKNPAEVYCTQMGYTYHIADTPTGQRGLCQLSDGSLVDSWMFLRGKVKKQFSVCERDGLDMKTVSGSRCGSIYSDECAVCVTSDGEKEISRYMGLDFIESTCGDGVCGLPENYKTCPEDCESNAEDGVCNSILKDGCDPDCMPDEDLDCQPEEGVADEKPVEGGGGTCIPALSLVFALAAAGFGKAGLSHIL